MLAIKRTIGWLSGKALLYVALVLAILAGAFVAPWLESQWRNPSRQLARAEQLETQVTQPLAAQTALAQERLRQAGGEARNKSLEELNAAIARAEAARTTAANGVRSPWEKLRSLNTGNTRDLLDDGKRELEIRYRDAEIAGLSAARDRLDGQRRAARTDADRARVLCRAARLKFEQSEARWQVRATLGIYDATERQELQTDRQRLCAASIAADRRQIEAQALRNTAAWTETRIGAVTTDVDQWIADTRLAARGTWLQKLSLWAERVDLATAMKNAALALAAIMALPYLIRLLCYFVLAPLAMRRPAVRVVAAGDAGAAIPLATNSTTSVEVRLAPGEELLVRHGYLQTTSDAGAKSTQWLLDVRHPITSLITGLSFLTRIRGQGEVTSVSAVRDPFAEVTVVTLPEGSACVLQPRALAAVAQPIDHRLQVTAHWRLFSLHAWLTLQLRFLVFHGPVRLVLKGGRGVRVERAERGRIFGQDQVVGFSTDLAYSVTRNETFWPYFLGREPLLKDRVAAGNGVLIVEEAPLAGRGAGGARGGIEGAIDAVMKVFGL